MILHFSQNAKKKTSRKKEVFFYGKLLFSKRTSLVKGRGTIALSKTPGVQQIRPLPNRK